MRPSTMHGYRVRRSGFPLYAILALAKRLRGLVRISYLYEKLAKLSGGGYLFAVFVSTAAVMLAYEFTKELCFPDMSKWDSHIITIILASVLACSAGFFIKRYEDSINARLSWIAGDLDEREADRKRITERLIESESRFRLLAENIRAALSIYFLDTQTIVHLNGVFRDLTGIPDLPPGETIARLLEITHPDDRQRVAFSYNRHEADTIVYRISDRNGRTRWLQRQSVPVKHATGEVKSIVCITTDISEQKEAETAAEQHRRELILADKMASLGRIVSGVAHEINNPNNFVMLNAPLLRKAWESALPVLREKNKETGDIYIGKMKLDEFSEYVLPLIDGITDGSKRIARIVEDLKDYVRQGAYDVNRHIDFSLVIRSAVNLMKNEIAKKNIELILTIGTAPVFVRGCPQRLEQVLINLLQNSCDAINRESVRSIVLSLEDSFDNVIRCNVRDTGCGITPEDLPHITEPFFTTKRDSGGTGLGLSVSDKIVTDHGGRLLFTSETGQGTTATLVLP